MDSSTVYDLYPSAHLPWTMQCRCLWTDFNKCRLASIPCSIGITPAGPLHVCPCQICNYATRPLFRQGPSCPQFRGASHRNMKRGRPQTTNISTGDPSLRALHKQDLRLYSKKTCIEEKRPPETPSSTSRVTANER